MLFALGFVIPGLAVDAQDRAAGRHLVAAAAGKDEDVAHGQAWLAKAFFVAQKLVEDGDGAVASHIIS